MSEPTWVDDPGTGQPMHGKSYKVRPPNWLARIWYRRTGETGVVACSFDPIGDIARLVPYRFRRFHGLVAILGGYFWKPCPQCDRPFGGHEGGRIIPNPLGDLTAPWLELCSECSRRSP